MRATAFDGFTRELGATSTRRGILRFVVGLPVLSAGLILTGHDDGVAKRKRKKKRPRPTSPPPSPAPATPDPCAEQQNNTSCNGDGRCSGGTCVTCQPEGTPCASYDGCCSLSCDFLVGGGTCSPCRGQGCSADFPCCGGLACVNSYCDGCRDRAVVCSNSSQCCFSDCADGVCLSTRGGTCARDVDCRACYHQGACANACVNGRCTV